jgi:hypothetical protein
MILEIEEYELPEGKTIFDKDAYPSSGLYIVNDGAMYNLVYIPRENSGIGVFSIPISTDILTKYLVEKTIKSTEKVITDCLTQQFEKMEAKANTLTVPVQSCTQVSIDSDTLLKAIAIAQDPNLSLNLLSKNDN